MRSNNPTTIKNLSQQEVKDLCEAAKKNQAIDPFATLESESDVAAKERVFKDVLTHLGFPFESVKHVQDTKEERFQVSIDLEKTDAFNKKLKEITKQQPPAATNHNPNQATQQLMSGMKKEDLKRLTIPLETKDIEAICNYASMKTTPPRNFFSELRQQKDINGIKNTLAFVFKYINLPVSDFHPAEKPGEKTFVFIRENEWENFQTRLEKIIPRQQPKVEPTKQATATPAPVTAPDTSKKPREIFEVAVGALYREAVKKSLAANQPPNSKKEESLNSVLTALGITAENIKYVKGPEKTSLHKFTFLMDDDNYAKVQQIIQKDKNEFLARQTRQNPLMEKAMNKDKIETPAASSAPAASPAPVNKKISYGISKEDLFKACGYHATIPSNPSEEIIKTGIKSALNNLQIKIEDNGITLVKNVPDLYQLQLDENDIKKIKQNLKPKTPLPPSTQKQPKQDFDEVTLSPEQVNHLFNIAISKQIYLKSMDKNQTTFNLVLEQCEIPANTIATEQVKEGISFVIKINPDNVEKLATVLSTPTTIPAAAVATTTNNSPPTLPTSSEKPKNLLIETVVAATKSDFTEQLKNVLMNKSTTISRQDILEFFKALKEPKGKYEFLHNKSIFAYIPLLFKRRANNEEWFWHTSSYQEAVKLLKKAYVGKNPIDFSMLDLTNDQVANLDEQKKQQYNKLKELKTAEDNFIDYVRGNAPAHHEKTSTRQEFKPQNIKKTP